MPEDFGNRGGNDLYDSRWPAPPGARRGDAWDNYSPALFDEPQIRIVEGLRLHHGIPPATKSPSLRPVILPCEQDASLVLDDSRMAVNTLLVGRTRSGKTNLIKHTLNALSRGAYGSQPMSDEDVCLVLDVTGDYAAQFFRPGKDLIVGRADSGETAVWNLFEDLRGPDLNTQKYILNAVGKLLFEKNREHPGANPFFEDGSRNLFIGVLRLLLKQARPDNSLLVEFWEKASPASVYAALSGNVETASLADYLSPQAPQQAFGLIGSLRPVILDVLQGAFARAGTLSIRKKIQEKGGRILFLDFPVSTGATQAAGFRVLFDLAIREAIALGEEERRRTGEVKGRCYFIVDEASRFGGPLLHLEEGLNTGSQLGLRFILGMQSQTQLFDAFGRKASSILAGLNNMFAFNCTETETTEFVKRRCGQCTKWLVIKNEGMGDPIQPVFESDVCGDHDIWDLRPGEAIVTMPGTPEPFRTRFCEFEPFRANVART